MPSQLFPRPRTVPPPSAPRPLAGAAGATETIFPAGAVQDLDRLIDDTARAEGVDPDLFRRLVRQESGGRPGARSPKGALGLAQLMPATAAELGVDPTDPVQNLRGGARYLRQMLDRFGGDEALALAAYNAGPGAVTKHGGIPPFRETQTYVRRILQGRGTQSAAQSAAQSAGQPGQASGPPAAPAAPPDPGAADVIFDPTALRPASGLAAPAAGGPPQYPHAIVGEALLGFGRDLLTNPAEAVASRAAGAARWIADSTERIRSTAANVLPLAGAYIGGTVGARAAGPKGALFGSVAGGELGELTSMGVDLATGAPPTYDDIQKRMALTGVTSLAGEGLGQLGVRAGKAVVGHVLPPAREALTRLGQVLTPAQASDSRALGFVENVIEGSIAGGGTRKRLIAEQEQRLAQERMKEITEPGRAGGGVGPVSREEAGRSVQAALTRDPRLGPSASERVAGEAEAAFQQELAQAEAQMRDTLSRVSGATPKGAGASAQTARKAAVDVFRARERELYGDFEQKAGGVVVEVAPRLDAFAQQLLGRERANIAPGQGLRAAQKVAQLLAPAEEGAEVVLGGAFAGAKIEDLPSALRAAVAEVASEEAPPPLTAVQFQKTVSSLNRVVRQLTRAAQTDPTKNADLGMAKRLLQLAREDLEDTLGRESPEALEALTTATGFSRAENQRLFNESVRKMAKAAPEKVVDQLLQKNNSTAITLVRDAVGEGSMQQIREVALQQLLRPNPRTDKIALDQVLSRMARLGDDTLDALFPGGEHRAVRSLAQRMQGRASMVQSIRKAAVRPPDTAEVKFLKKITAAQPDAVVGMLLSPKRPLPARIVREAVGPRVWRQVQASTTEQILREAKTGKALQAKLEALGKDTLRDLYPEGADQGLWSLARIQSHLEKPREGTGKVAIQLMQASAGITLIVNPLGVFGEGTEGTRAGSAAAIILGPAALGRVLMSPVGRRYLIAAAEGKSGTAATFRAATHLSAWVARELGEGTILGPGTKAEDLDAPENPFGPVPSSFGPPPPNPFVRPGGR